MVPCKKAYCAAYKQVRLIIEEIRYIRQYTVLYYNIQCCFQNQSAWGPLEVVSGCDRATLDRHNGILCGECEIDLIVRKCAIGETWKARGPGGKSPKSFLKTSPST